MSRKNYLIGIIVVFAAVILQTTALNVVSFRGIKPDLVLIIVILISNYSGSVSGQLLGFSAGLAEDFLSMAPLGFNALNKAVTGYIAGKTEGKMFLDPVITPVILVLAGTGIKAFLSFILFLVFFKDKAEIVFSLSLLIEVGMNIVLTPIVFWLLKLVRVLPSSNNARRI